MSLFSSPIFAVLNPFGFIATKVQNANGGDAKTRVANWFASGQNPILPGCNPNLLVTGNCTFDGTASDWAQYRENWIQDCTSANSGSGILESKNLTLTACQACFDANSTAITMQMDSADVTQQNQVLSLLQNTNPVYYVIAFAFVGLIIYLLMSK